MSSTNSETSLPGLSALISLNRIALSCADGEFKVPGERGLFWYVEFVRATPPSGILDCDRSPLLVPFASSNATKEAALNPKAMLSALMFASAVS
jgi:hypothetical protein